jgi:hypothetical protein
MVLWYYGIVVLSYDTEVVEYRDYRISTAISRIGRVISRDIPAQTAQA